MNTKTKKLLYLLFIYLTPLQAAQKETGIINNQSSFAQYQMEQEEKKEDPEDNLQNDLSFGVYTPLNQQQEKPIVDPLRRMSEVQSQPVDGFEITQCIQQTNDNFTEFLDQYADSFTETIRVSFHVLNNHSSSTSEEITEAIEALIKCFETLQGISTRTPDVFKKLFPNEDPITVAQNKLQNLSKDIERTIHKQKQQTSVSLNHTLQVVEYLTNLDGYLPQKNRLNFSQIYQTNSQAFYSDVIELPKVQENMERKNYKDVAKSMKELLEIKESSSNDVRAKKALEVIQRTVEQDLKNRIKTIRRTIMLSQSEVKADAIFDLQNELATLDSAMEAFCPKDCDLLDKSIQNDLFKQKKRVYQNLAEWMKEFITKIKTFINSFDFQGAEELIQQLRKINQILGENMIDTDENDTGMNPHKEMVNKIKEVEKDIQAKLKEQIDEYKAVTLHDKKFNPYAANPPVEFCRKLKAAQSKHARYSEAVSDIQRDIFKKVRELMTKGLEDPLQTRKCFNLCRNILTSLPQEWAKVLETEINQRSEEAKELKTQEDAKVVNIMQIGVTDDMYQLLRKLKERRDTINVSKVESRIYENSEIKFKNIQGYIREGNIQKACYLLTELYQEKCHYSDLCPFIKKYHENALSLLSAALEMRTKFLNDNLSSPNKKSNKLVIEKMRIYLNQIQQFQTYRAQIKK